MKKSQKIKIIKLKPFKDHRGVYVESFHQKRYKKKYKITFKQDDFSSSKKNVLRGFHGDDKTWKLFSCVKGEVQFAFINYDVNSKQFKNNFNITLKENDYIQLLVPPKFGTAHLVLSKKATIHYKQSSYYKEFNQFTINYKSPCLKFKWKSKKIITSKRDSGGLVLA
jgi:dTDP-4-dehydrorhamnose 3,5-epimerase